MEETRFISLQERGRTKFRDVENWTKNKKERERGLKYDTNLTVMKAKYEPNL